MALAWLMNLGFGASPSGFVPPPTPVSPPSSSGGFFYDYEAYSTRRARRKREQEEREAETQSIQETLDRDIAELLRIQEAKDAEREESQRLASIVRQYADRTDGLSDRVRIAYTRALMQSNFSAMQALEREVQRQFEEEEVAALMMLLNQED